MISVIIPVYNAENYLSKCLDSVINQSYSDLQIIIVNDGSTDKSQNIIDSFIEKDKRIISIIQENKGISSARNSGLNRATGEFITFLDSDDWIDLSMYEKLIQNLIKYDADIVVCGVDDEYKNNSITSFMLKDEIINDIPSKREQFFVDRVLNDATVVWNKLYKRNIIIKNEILFTDRKIILQEDFLFNFKYYLTVNTVVNISDVLVHYRVRKSSVSKMRHVNMIEKNLHLIDYMYDYIKKFEYSDQLYKFLAQKSYSMFNIATYQSDDITIKEIKDIIIKSTQNKFFRMMFPPKLQQMSTKKIFRYVLDSLIYKKAYNIASLLQWFRVKLYYKKINNNVNVRYD